MIIRNKLKAFWHGWKETGGYKHPVRRIPMPIYSEDTEHSVLEQRIIRLEKARDKDYEFIMDVLNNHQYRIQELEGINEESDKSWQETIDKFNLRDK